MFMIFSCMKDSVIYQRKYIRFIQLKKKKSSHERNPTHTLIKICVSQLCKLKLNPVKMFQEAVINEGQDVTQTLKLLEQIKGTTRCVKGKEESKWRRRREQTNEMRKRGGREEEEGEEEEQRYGRGRNEGKQRKRKRMRRRDIEARGRQGRRKQRRGS